MIRKKYVTQLLIILLTVMLLGMDAMMIPAQAAMPFSDVPTGKWYTDAVQYCFDRGYVGGYKDGTFRPDNKMTRAEMAVIMNKMLGLKESAPNTFSDVPSGQWFTDPILHCVKAGVMTGFSSKQFGTNDKLTREQGAVILAKAFGVEEASGRTAFTDDPSISSWAVGAVKAMAGKGLISGMGDNKFQPKTPLSRAMMCQIIYAAEKKTGNDPTPSPSTSPQPAESTKPTDSIIPVVTEENDTIRAGAVINTTSNETWNTLMQQYMAEYGQAKVKPLYVDNDNNRELLILGERGSGNEKLITYHNGTVSILPLNGAALAFVPKGNAILVGEYEDGTYYLSTYAIKNGKWALQSQGSFQDPPGGPQTDKDGNDVYVNYKWNGKSVSEEAFYLGLISAIDVTKLETIEN